MCDDHPFENQFQAKTQQKSFLNNFEKNKTEKSISKNEKNSFVNNPSQPRKNLSNYGYSVLNQHNKNIINNSNNFNRNHLQQYNLQNKIKSPNNNYQASAYMKENNKLVQQKLINNNKETFNIFNNLYGRENNKPKPSYQKQFNPDLAKPKTTKIELNNNLKEIKNQFVYDKNEMTYQPSSITKKKKQTDLFNDNNNYIDNLFLNNKPKKISKLDKKNNKIKALEKRQAFQNNKVKLKRSVKGN